MEELGFTPSPAARRLSLGRTLTIGVVVSFLTRPQAAERLRGVDAVLTDSEFDLVIYNVESVEKRDHYLGTLAQSQRTDGLLVMSLPPPDEAVPTLVRGPVPVVFIDVHTPSVAAMPRVVGDDVAGGALAARHLLELGHTAIGFVGDAFARPVRLHLEPRPRAGPDRRAGARRRLDPATTGSATAPTAATRRATWPAGCSPATDDRRPSSPPATPRPWASSPRPASRAPRPRRPVGHRLRRHRGRRLRRADDGPPAAASNPAAGAPRSCWPRSASDPRSRPSFTWPPSWWSARPRRHRRRAVDEDRSDGSAPARDTDEEECSWSASDSSAPGRRSPAARLAALAVASILVAACAAPGAVVVAVAGGDRGADRGRTVGERRAASAPSASAAAAGPSCGTDPVVLNAYFETGFDLPFKLSRRVHQAVPERDLGHQPGPVHEPHDRDAAPAVG